MAADRVAPFRRRALLALPVLVAACAAAAEPPVDLSPTLERFRGDGRVPGLVAVVTDAERIVAQGAAGARVLGRPEAITADDLLHIGSITKPFTATLLAQLVDEGKLRWETTLAEAVPEVGPPMRPEYRAVTIAQLLSHEAGIQPFEDDQSQEILGLPPALEGDVRAQRRQFVAYALSLAPVHPPGTAFRYSNAGFTVAASIAETVTGKTWEDLVRERLFVPLGMTTAGFGWPNMRQADAPWGHVEEDGRLRPTPPDDPYQLPAWTAPAGDLSVSAPDLARFARLHLRGFDGKDTTLAPETFRAMHTKRIRSGLGGAPRASWATSR